MSCEGLDYAELRLRVIEVVLTFARLRGATSLDVQEVLSAKRERPSADFGLRRTLGALPSTKTRR